MRCRLLAGVLRTRARYCGYIPRDSVGRAQIHIERRIDILPPYRFSIAISDILREFVTEQYDLPLTRQTSIEFLNTLQSKSRFSDDEKTLLADFLNRCDLIKFARYDATIADSLLLLEGAKFCKRSQSCADDIVTGAPRSSLPDPGTSVRGRALLVHARLRGQTDACVFSTANVRAIGKQSAARVEKILRNGLLLLGCRY